MNDVHLRVWNDESGQMNFEVESHAPNAQVTVSLIIEALLCMSRGQMTKENTLHEQTKALEF